MAKSRFEYVRNYELPDPLMPNAFIVVRIDGRGFHKFSDTHSFQKPNDKRALDLMDIAAKTVMTEYKDVILAFGESDEYSFLLRRNTKLYNRRRSKISSSIVSLFTSAYVFHWSHLFPEDPLKYPPSFDSRVIVYPTEKEIRDYFAWRQADTHINNLYNTAFWALVHDGQSTTEANKTLQGTDSKDKNELLFSKYGINYNDLPAMYRKGSICVRSDPRAVSGVQQTDVPVSASASASASAFAETSALSSLSISNGVSKTGTEDHPHETNEILQTRQSEGQKTRSAKKIKPYEGIDGEIVVLHEDIIKDRFWDERPWLTM
ncbi:uncharacterized protein I303_107868 [Kwoniella dejecticola CBS 10117]|uniref:tRNA(His) guanylyltransferase n=1 Tax=Kwoniella dejecticola CBS 10117 TaxID=1296121 RepID=A0A1A5ZVX0_9TREE|nr:tRNA(His) guanylyltransferase [Kwoniella dejecticola CBS 10117]OBR81958.1 tRNA(His) guanylyltransferase [Kwoniella dejecticola CBS 10117]